MDNSEVMQWKWFHYFSSCFSEYDMKENDEEFDAEDPEDNDVAIPRRYVEEDKVLETCVVKCSERRFSAKNVVRILK